MNAKSTSMISTDESDTLSLPLFLSSSSSSLKSLRERNRTNFKRRINLSHSQVLSSDFEDEDNLTTTTTVTTNKQLSSNSTIHVHTELDSRTASPRTPSPIRTTVTCSQVWERLASNEERQNSISPKSNTTSISNLPTHISFSYDPSDNDDEVDDLLQDDRDDFQYVPVSSQSKLVQFQFLTFARQQQLNSNNDDEEENVILNQNMIEDQVEEEDECEQENRTSKKRKRSVSTMDSLSDKPVVQTIDDDTVTSSSIDKSSYTKKPKIRDPNTNYQRLNMRKKHFSHAKKHQFSKYKRNAFYRRMRHAGGTK